MYDIVVKKFTFAISSPDDFVVFSFFASFFSVFGSVRYIKLASSQVFGEKSRALSHGR